MTSSHLKEWGEQCEEEEPREGEVAVVLGTPRQQPNRIKVCEGHHEDSRVDAGMLPRSA